MSFTADAVKSSMFVMLVVLVIHTLLDRVNEPEKNEGFPNPIYVVEPQVHDTREEQKPRDELYDFVQKMNTSAKPTAPKRSEPVAAFGGGGQGYSDLN
jgi:hypothetical protein